MQSPIDLPAHSGIAQDELNMTYDTPTYLEVGDDYINGLFLYVDDERVKHPPTLSYKGLKYKLLMMTIHTGSQHTIESRRYPGSFNFIYSADEEASDVVMVAVFLNDGASKPNSAINDLENNVKNNQAVDLGRITSGLDLRYYWEYTGSLTWPDCREKIQWIVLRDTVQVTKNQIVMIRGNSGNVDTYRDTMPLNGRVVRGGCPKGQEGCQADEELEENEWSYPYNETEWGRAYPTCQNGSMQSPIDLPAHSGIAQDELNMTYDTPTYLEVGDDYINGLFLYVDDERVKHPPTLSYKGLKYKLLMMTIHTGSQHTIESRRYPGSFNFIYSADEEASDVVMVAVFLNDGASKPNSAINDLENNVKNNQAVDLGRITSGLDLRYYWEYTGSLTWPDCREKIKWIVLRDTVQVTKYQIDMIRGNSGNVDTFRDTMPLNGRVVRDGSESGACKKKREWTKEIASENCPTKYSSKIFSIRACRSSYQKRLEASLANQLYGGCRSRCVYDYDSVNTDMKGAFLYRRRKKCYKFVTRGGCFKTKKYREVLKRAGELC